MKTKHAAFSLYKKKVGTRYYWYARFWDAQRRTYSITRSIGIEVAGKKERRGDAEKAAAALLASITFNASQAGLIEFLEKFWAPNSRYFKEAEIVTGRKLAADYSAANRSVIKNHIAQYPPFQGIKLGDLSAGLIRDFMLWETERGTSGHCINRALQAIRVPMRYAVARDEVQHNPFDKVQPARHEAPEKGILSREEALKLINSPYSDKRKRLAILLGLLCGMRLGEVRGLHWEDIDEEKKQIHIRHNWQDPEDTGEQLKVPKYNSVRFVPLPAPVAALLHECGGGSGLVFAREKDECPLCGTYFRIAFARELERVGITKEERRKRNMTFHSLRHSFVSLCRLSGLNDFQTQGLAGHKSAKMMDRYSHAQQAVEMNACAETWDAFLQKN